MPIVTTGTTIADPGGLTERQAAFVAALFDRSGPGYLCATRAAAVAGYRWPGKQGPRLLTMPAVRAAAEAAFRPLQEQAAGGPEALRGSGRCRAEAGHACRKK